ncbi:MAG: hypothetical protein FWG09_04850 [Synergistaceae bacterium]|nr:hypothetical protein [Synergistaceae bacterium]
MPMHTAEMTKETFQNTLRNMSALSDESFLKLAEYIEELIEDQEEAEDAAYIDARKDEPTIPFEDIIAKYEAEYGPLDQI